LSVKTLDKPRRIALDDFPAWAEAHLGPKDAAVLEATGNALLCLPPPP